MDLFATGGIFNRPTGTASERNEVVARAVRAVGNAEAGARIRLAATRLDDLDLMRALLAAAARGVAIQVVLAEGSGTYAEQTLAATLGPDPLLPSWVKKCVGTCLGGAGTNEANFLLVSRSGGATEVSLALERDAAGQVRPALDRRFLSTDTYVYTGYDQTFEQLAADTADTRTTRTVTWGPSYAAQLYPMPVGAKDPMLKSLKRVKCKPGKTVVRATAATPGPRPAARRWPSSSARCAPRAATSGRCSVSRPPRRSPRSSPPPRSASSADPSSRTCCS